MTGRVHFWSRQTDIPPARITIIRSHKDTRLWRDYLKGADARYAEYDLKGVTEDHVDAGENSDTWCTLAWLDGELAGGMRMHVAQHLPILDELKGHVNLKYLAPLIRGRQADGVVHCGGLWVNKKFRGYPNLTADLARSHLVMVRLVRARWSVGTSAEHTLDAWSSLGYRVDPSIPPFPYPADRYLTRVLWCDTRALHGAETGLRAWMTSQADCLSATAQPENAAIAPFRRP